MLRNPDDAFKPALARYGSGAMLFHWVVAAMILFLGGLGLLLEDLPRGVQGFWINVHGTVGLAYFMAVIARVLWRTTHSAPDLPPDVGEFSRRASHPVHLVLYLLMVVVPIVGIVAYIWHARAFNFGLFSLNFGQPLTRSVFKPAEEVHGWLAYTLFGVAGVHALAALWHHFVLRDGILARMMPGRLS